MSSPNRYPRKNFTKLRHISVARTVEAPQEPVERFLIEAGRQLGRRATVSVLTSARMTILESNGISRALRDKKTDPKATAAFSYRLSSRLDAYRCHGMVMDVDPDKPLVFTGRNDNRLAFNLVSSDESREERERVEDLLQEEFGKVPKLKQFDEHVTWGNVHIRQINKREQENPALLMPEIEIPTHVALNGLSVFMDGEPLIHR